MLEEEGVEERVERQIPELQLRVLTLAKPPLPWTVRLWIWMRTEGMSDDPVSLMRGQLPCAFEPEATAPADDDVLEVTSPDGPRS